VEVEFYQPGLIDQTSCDKNLAIKVRKNKTGNLDQCIKKEEVENKQ
jgi:hypothetical protein